MLRCTALVVTLLAFTSHSNAQALTGIASPMLTVDVEPATYATACGISTARVDAALRTPISNSRLVAAKTGDSVLSAQVNVVQWQTGMCAASVTIALSRPLSLQPDPRSPRVFGDVWSKSYVLIGPPENFSRAVYDKVDDYTKQFIGAWLKDNL
jgi:hypothetical protein